MRTVIHERDLNAKYLVTGLPGMGRAGHVAAAYILSKMENTLVVDIYSEYFPQQVVIGKGGIISPIRNRLYYVKADEPFFVLTGDSQPLGASPADFYKYIEQVLEIVKGLGVNEIYTLAGIDRGVQRLASKPGVVVAGTDEEIIHRFKELGAKVDDSGAITGVAGLFIGMGTLDGLRGACLMGETSAQLTAHGDPGAALAVTQMISKYLGFHTDLSELEKAAEGFDVLLKKMVAPQKDESKLPEPTDYIR